MDGLALGPARTAWPCTWENLLLVKNLLQTADAQSTVFPTTGGGLDRRSLGVGARFTTLHWPAVEWVMAQLGISLVANQNSIPRELVWDVEAMRAGSLDRVPFPFIGCDVPEGHQGQSVEGMSHGAVLSKLATGFHRQRLEGLGLGLEADATADLLARVWPAMLKLQRRDRAYAAVRQRLFTTALGRAYVRELSIDELPGLTSPATLAAMLALAEALEVRIHYVAPAFGFQKNHPFADQAELERRIGAAWRVCAAFGVSLGFHSGSGKSAENYRLCGRLTGGNLEIKTSGRYTYEMGRALAASSDPADQALWRDWNAFTCALAVDGAFAELPAQRDCARQFISDALTRAGRDPAPFASRAACAGALAGLAPDPDHMFWFEYNFLFVLAAEGRSTASALGDHSPAGYRQRARFYAISAQARLGYLRNVAGYLILLAESTGLVPAATCIAARQRLASYGDLAALLGDIAP